MKAQAGEKTNPFEKLFSEGTQIYTKKQTDRQGEEEMDILDPRIGMEYEGYIIEKALGAGGMGRVYLGRHKAVGNKVAIKIVDLLGFNQNPQLQARFLREARALYALKGVQCIADILQVRSDSPNPGIITEYIDGKSFDHYTGGNDIFTKRQNFGVIIKIAGALVKVHEQGIKHRDLKPENIMIEEVMIADGELELHPKLIDFGISQGVQQKGEEKLTSADNPFGSPLWAAPEMFEAPDKIDHTVDIFSMGLMAYLCLNGEHFYGDVSRFNVMSGYMRMNQTITFAKDGEKVKEALKKLPSEAAKIVARCVCYNPAERIQTAEELRDLCLEYDRILEKEEKEAIALGKKPQIRIEKPKPASQTAFFGSGAITACGPAAVSNKNAETVPDTSVSAPPEAAPETPTPTAGNEKKKRGRALALLIGLVACVGIAGMILYIIKKEPSASTESPLKLQTQSKAKIAAPKPRFAPKKPALPKPPAKGQRPSNAYVSRLYKAIEARCKEKDPKRKEFEKSPHYHLGCIRWYVQKIRDKDSKNFDKVALMTFVLNEARIHFCFYKRTTRCGVGTLHFLVNECKLVAFKVGVRKKGPLRHKKLTASMDGQQAGKIYGWVTTHMSKEEKNKIRSAWIKSQPPDRMLCFKKRR
ncbi:MAG: serine/threonine-protein kinase [Nitrospirota bacterium]